MSRIVLPSKQQGETKTYAFDFASFLANGETLSTASVTATVYSGVDVSPSAIVSGSASISGTTATQLLTAGVVGVVYDVSCAVTTSAGQTLRLTGYVAIVPNLP